MRMEEGSFVLSIVLNFSGLILDSVSKWATCAMACTPLSVLPEA